MAEVCSAERHVNCALNSSLASSPLLAAIRTPSFLPQCGPSGRTFFALAISEGDRTGCLRDKAGLNRTAKNGWYLWTFTFDTCHSARMDVTDRNRAKIAKATLHIENNLAEPLRVSEIAKHANLSAFHFQRLFSAYRGEPISQYISARRLERAAIELTRNPNVNLLQLGLDSGFQTHSAFSKAFKRQFGVTPSAFRKAPSPLREGADQGRRLLVSVPQSRGFETIDIVKLPHFHFQFRTSFGTCDGQFFRQNDQDIGQQFAALLNEKAVPDLFLMSCFPDTPQNLNDSNALVWFGGAFSTQTETGWSNDWYQFDVGEWAVFEHRGDYGFLYQTWNRIYRNWFAQSEYLLRDELPFEAYVTPAGQTGQSAQVTKIYIPVKRA